MKTTILILLFALNCCNGFAQNKVIDSLKHELAVAKHDTSRALIMGELCSEYRFSKPDSAIKYGQQALELSRQIKFQRGESFALVSICWTLRELGNLPKALDLALQALRIAEDGHYRREIGICKTRIGNIYHDLKNYPVAINYYKQSQKIFEELNLQKNIPGQQMNIGSAYLYENRLDSAAYYLELAHQGCLKYNLKGTNVFVMRNLGLIQAKLGNASLAKFYFEKSILLAIENNDHRNASHTYTLLAGFYKDNHQLDSCIFYASKGLTKAQLGPFPLRVLELSRLLSEAYKLKSDFKNAYKYQQLMVQSQEGLFGLGNIQAMQTMIADEQKRQQKIETERIAYQNQIKQYALLAGLGTLLLIAFVLYRNNQKEKKAKTLLQEKNKEIQSTLETLKSTQAQLIQKEKLASLGELTAGIAHEIQNPLNFVNNFSELSVELIEEAPKPPKGANEDWIPQEAPFGGWGAFFADLTQNLQKINLHGKRASSIVKGMLEHSRMSTGVKELTDINKLADEYLRLSYHGLRAKDKNFNADYELIADENLPLINIIPQDIGRVLLNLINNAFWAVKTVEKPLVTVTTEQSNNQIIIKVTDNGIGMSEATKAKIFQPFFTTKPTGEGTGLGLSLSYDIVTKGHGGTIEVESVEGEKTTFVVKLPFETHG